MRGNSERQETQMLHFQSQLYMRNKEAIYSLNFILSSDIYQQKLLSGSDRDKSMASSICRLPVMPSQLKQAGRQDQITH